MGQHSATTIPAKVRFHSTELACDVARVYAYRGYCACGWVGPKRDKHSEARSDAREHSASERAREAASPSGGTEAS